MSFSEIAPTTDEGRRASSLIYSCLKQIVQNQVGLELTNRRELGWVPILGAVERRVQITLGFAS